MNESRPLYNSRNIKIWIEYLQRYHPGVNLSEVLTFAGMDMYEVEDQGHWFTQEQVDRLYENVRKQTADPEIARKAGRYIAVCGGLGYINQFAQAFFITPQTTYRLVARISELFSRGATLTTRRTGANQAEVIAVPNPGVREKPYQCENRTGLLEALPQIFTGTLATIEHPECWHRGDGRCLYRIAWKRTIPAFWTLARNILGAAGAAASLVLLFFLSLPHWMFATAVISLGVLVVWIGQLYQSNLQLTRSIQTHSNQADDYMNEMNLLYKHAVLIQEIGQATANIRQEKDLISSVTRAMEKNLHFDRGMIMLADKNRSRLTFSSGYGYGKNLEDVVRNAEFNLDKSESKGVFVKTFREKKPFLIHDLNILSRDLSARSSRFANLVGAKALVCVPITYGKESIGILVVDNVKSQRPLRKSDTSLLSGIASYVAVGLMNARAFQNLVDSGKKYRDLVENANSIILRRDPTGVITFFNEFAQRFFDYREDAIIGKNFFGAILPDTRTVREEFEALTDALIQDPETHIVKETKSELQNGETVWIAWTHKPIPDRNGNIVEILCIGNDITQLKRAQNDKKELEARLARAQKMEALGTLAGGVAHDLNNILAGLVSYPELLLLRMDKTDPMRKAISTIKQSGEKATAIVQDLLTLARRGVPTTDVVNLNDIIAEYRSSPEHAKLQAEFPGVGFDFTTEPDLLNISGSPVHLSKTLMNLVSNAAEATELGGLVKIHTQSCYVDRPIGGYDHVEQGDYSVLTVSDNGIGISADDLERIFEPFYTKKKMGRSGTGLGMAVVWGTVKDHRGYIDVESKTGEGSTFTIFFPATRQHREIRAAPLAIDELLGNGENILIIDDMEDQREIAQAMLTALNYSVAAVDSGEAAVIYMQNNRPDLLLLDMIMGAGMDGLETYREICRTHPRQKAIITSGFSETGKVRETQRLGAGAYVKKPFSIEKIGSAIRNALAGDPDRL